MSKRGSGVRVKCGKCKAVKVLTLAEAAELDSPPMCGTCFLPMECVEIRLSGFEVEISAGPEAPEGSAW